MRASFTRRDLRRRASRRAPRRDAGCPPLDPGGTPRRAIALPGASCLDLGIAEAMNSFRHIRVPAHGRGPGIDRKALWVVSELGLPTIVKTCVSCRSTRHRPTGKIRVNANHKLLDVWLLICCDLCGRTSKIPVHERINVRALDNERLLRFENNDPAMVRQLTMDATLAHKAAYQLDWTGTWQLDTDIPFYDLQREDAAPLEVIIRFELPAPIRVEKLLTAGFGLSRPAVRGMVDSGRIRLPLPIDAKAREDFTFLVVTAPPLSPERA
ncbi:DUF1062 domain-containing protein [Micromonospora sp. NPDC047548]|uniref:DUF1062 domain-containing protein n=1 Tax=Micromonospora sp. NPDC047548 TaxID=3155624 RepID=UPI0033FB0DA2